MKKIPAITVMAVLGRRHQAPFDGEFQMLE
jgi:hypothetical protein